MAVPGDRRDGGPDAADVRVRVPRRQGAWGSRVRWTPHAVQGAVIAAIGWRAVNHVTSGGPSAESWCPLGGFETLWTLATTGRTVAHVHSSSLVLAAAVQVLALVGRGFFCAWLCPLGDRAVNRTPANIIDPCWSFPRVISTGRSGERARGYHALAGVSRGAF